MKTLTYLYLLIFGGIIHFLGLFRCLINRYIHFLSVRKKNIFFATYTKISRLKVMRTNFIQTIIAKQFLASGTIKIKSFVPIYTTGRKQFVRQFLTEEIYI